MPEGAKAYVGAECTGPRDDHAAAAAAPPPVAPPTGKSAVGLGVARPRRSCVKKLCGEGPSAAPITGEADAGTGGDSEPGAGSDAASVPPGSDATGTIAVAEQEKQAPNNGTSQNGMSSASVGRPGLRRNVRPSLKQQQLNEEEEEKAKKKKEEEEQRAKQEEEQKETELARCHQQPRDTTKRAPKKQVLKKKKQTKPKNAKLKVQGRVTKRRATRSSAKQKATATRSSAKRKSSATRSSAKAPATRSSAKAPATRSSAKPSATPSAAKKRKAAALEVTALEAPAHRRQVHKMPPVELEDGRPAKKQLTLKNGIALLVAADAREQHRQGLGPRAHPGDAPTTSGAAPKMYSMGGQSLKEVCLALAVTDSEKASTLSPKKPCRASVSPAARTDCEKASTPSPKKPCQAPVSPSTLPPKKRRREQLR